MNALLTEHDLYKVLERKMVVLTISNLINVVENRWLDEVLSVKERVKIVSRSSANIAVLFRKFNKSYPTSNRVEFVKWIWDNLNDKQLIEQTSELCEFLNDESFYDFRTLVLYICLRIKNTGVVTSILSKLVIYAVETQQQNCLRYLLSYRMKGWNLHKLTETALITAIACRLEETIRYLCIEKSQYIYLAQDLAGNTYEQNFQLQLSYMSSCLTYNDIVYFLRLKKQIGYSSAAGVQGIINDYILFMKAHEHDSTDLSKFILNRIEYNVRNVVYTIHRAKIEAVQALVEKFKDIIQHNEIVVDALVQRNNYEVTKPIYSPDTSDLIQSSIIMYLADNLISMVIVEEGFDLGMFLAYSKQKTTEIVEFVKKFIEHHGTHSVGVSYVLTLNNPDLLALYESISPIDFFRSQSHPSELNRRFMNYRIGAYDMANLVSEFDRLIKNNMESYARSAIISIANSNCEFEIDEVEMNVLYSEFPSWVNMVQELILKEGTNSFKLAAKVNSVIERRKQVEGTSVCAICREELRPRQKQLKPKCGHACHFNCIMKWFDLSGHHNCPQCRNHILFEVEKNLAIKV